MDATGFSQLAGHPVSDAGMTARVYFLVAGNERGGGASHLIALATAIREQNLENQFVFLLVGRGYLQERLQALGVQVMIREGGMRSVLDQFAQDIRQAISESPSRANFLHAHGPRMNILACTLARRTGIKWMSTVHSDPFKDFLTSRWKSLLFTRLNLFCLQRSAAVFLVSPEYAALTPKQKKFLVVNSVRLQPLSGDKQEYERSLRNHLGLAENSVLIGMAARFDPVKDIPTTLRAMKELAMAEGQSARRVPMHLVLAGDGPIRSELEQLAKDLSIEHLVHFLGFIDDVGKFYAGLTIHVLSSISEGTGLSIVEAGYYGVPTVASDIAGVRQLITDGETGLLFPPHNEQHLASAFRRLAQDDMLRQHLVQAFQNQVVPKYTPRKMLESYLQGYTELERQAKQD